MRQIFFFIVLSLLTSCAKEQDVFIPDSSQQVSQVYFHNLIDDQSSTLLANIQANRSTTVTDKISFLIDIPANSLLDQENNLIVGPVRLKLTRLSDEKANFIIAPNMIFANNVIDKPDLFTLEILYNGIDVKVVKPINIYLTLNEQFENQNSTQTYRLQDQEWVKESVTTKIEELNYNMDEVYVSFRGVKISINNAHQTMAFTDVSATSTVDGSICVKVEDSFNSRNTFMAFRSHDGKLIIHLKQKANGEFCSQDFRYSNNVSGDIIAISDLGNANYYFGKIATTFGSNQNTIQLTKSTIQDIKAAIEKL